MTGLAHTALASVLLAKGSHGPAEREAAKGEELRRTPDPEIEHTHAQLVLAEARLARGRRAQATADLALVEESLETFVDAGTLSERAERLAQASMLRRPTAISPVRRPVLRS